MIDRKDAAVGVIGVGRMGQYHAGAYAEMQNVTLAGVFDTDQLLCSEVAKKFRSRSCQSIDELLDLVDIVSIATPTRLHYEIAKYCLEAKVHVLVEKPITDNLEAAESLFKLAKQLNLELHVGHIERFNGAVQELKKVVHNPLIIEMRRMGPFDPRVQDGVILDLLIHDIDILLNLIDSDIKSIHGFSSAIETDKEDVANVQFLFENGCIANLIARRMTQEKVRTMSITQKEAYIVLDFAYQNILVHRNATTVHEMQAAELKYRQEQVIERIFVHRDNPLKLELRHLVDCAIYNKERNTSVENELRSLKVALSVLEKIEHIENKFR
ncbi:MAG: Gfo/Idh/MocA family oxidoreductase [Nitrospinota bacterium]